LVGATSWLLLGAKVSTKSGSPNSLLALFKRPDLADVKIFPTEANLSFKQDRQSLVVQAIYADGATRDVTAEASFSLANRALVKLNRNVLTPLADGKTELQVKYEGRLLTVPIVIQDAATERPISFKMDVMPV